MTNKNITTLEMEVAIMNYLGVRKNIIVPNVFWGLIDYEADIVSLTKSGYATEIEIKVSKSDLLADFKKSIQHNSNLFKYFYYAIPKDMQEYALDKIPKEAGLLVVSFGKDSNDLSVTEVRSPILNKSHIKWTDKDTLKLAELGCMRILGLKKKLIPKE